MSMTKTEVIISHLILPFNILWTLAHRTTSSKMTDQAYSLTAGYIHSVYGQMPAAPKLMYLN